MPSPAVSCLIRDRNEKRTGAGRSVVSNVCSTGRVTASVERFLEIAHFLLGALTLPAVLFLQLAGEILAVAGSHVEHVVGEIAPLRLGLALGAGSTCRK